ncbi:tetratricopeptide repeat protein [bacterium]|nr:MAG: tetratricopeptide repeat protein [bacterium]
MLACKHCSTPNSLDSTFCKKCGTAVPADLKREASLQLDKLVDEGLAALNAGRTSEALAIADSAVATDPTHLGALHLKSAVHERRGEIADALESAERIVELNPDSELDRIKRNGLRSSLLNASTPVVPDRRVAFVAAAAAMVLVACTGILLTRKPADAGSGTQVASNSEASSGPIVEPPVAVNPNPAQNVPQNNVQPNTVGGPVNEREPEVPRGDLPRPNSGEILPRPSESGESGTIQPITPNVGGSLQKLPDPANQNPTPSQPSPQPKVKDPDPPTLEKSPVAKEDYGQIDIKVSSGGSRRTGGSDTIPESRTNGAAAYARVGTERFGLGDYAGAATNLEKAVAGGGDAVQLNLRLAQAYSRLGRNSDAASAYERSRQAADAAIASGKGDKDRLQAARDAAEAGLRTVRGG